MKFLKLLIVVFLQIIYTESASSKKKNASIIVVGAGPAGVAAATKLLEHGFLNVKVLEAENRIGGRVNSVYFGEAFIDLGAEWCHGENIVYDLVKDYNIFGHTETPQTIHHSSKKRLDKDFCVEILNLMDSIYVPDGQRDFEEDDEERLQVAKSSMELFHHLVLSSEGAFSWYEPTAKNDYRDCKGDLNLHWNGLGYKTALEVLMKKFPDPSKQLPFDQSVLFNKEVTKVLYSSKSSISLRCSDGSAYEADHVIFTTSIGVLKENHDKIFYPPLPQAKQKAIRDIGFGAVMKIAMHFEDRFWDSGNFTGYYFIWSDDDKYAVSKEFPEGPVKEGRSWLTELFAILPTEHNPNVLIAWLTGELIPEIENLSNDTVNHGVVFVLNKFLGHQFNITEPNSVLKTTWYTNPHFRGTYSYQTADARKGEVSAEVELSKPILSADGRPVVQFAGEASHPYYYSTVHGAIETGHREADRLIEFYK